MCVCMLWFSTDLTPAYVNLTEHALHIMVAKIYNNDYYGFNIIIIIIAMNMVEYSSLLIFILLRNL